MIAADMLRSSSRLVSLSSLVLLSGLLNGCGAGGSATDSTVVHVAIQGTVHGGQPPVSGSTLQLWAAGTGGNGTAASALIPSGYYLPGGVSCAMGTANCSLGSVVSDRNGNFNITGDYTCPASDPEVYITASGGNPGLTAGTNNAALVMMAALTDCNSLSSVSNIWIDEVTTVAAAWALAPFMTSAGNVASSSTNYAVGLTNAFKNAHLLADTTTGMAATLPSNLSIQTGKLYALADALGGCVNSDGTTGCSALFSAATPSGGTAPNNTLTAALNIVKNPSNKVGPVFMAIPTSPAYATTLTQAPNDWTMSLSVTGGGLYGPTQLATDTQGNVWVADYFGAVSAFSPQGAAISPAATGSVTSGGFGNGSLDGIYGLAVDTNDNIFVTNELKTSTSGSVGSVSILNGVTSGNTLGSLVTNTANSTPYFSDTSIQYPESLATDTNGNILIGLDNGASASYVTIYNSSGGLVRAGLGIPLGSGVFGVSADQSHGAWMANNAGNTVTHADPNGQVISASNCCSEPTGVATDSLGNAWVSNFGSNSISEIAPGCDTNTINRSSTCTGTGGNVITLNQVSTGGLYSPQGIVVDAGQNVWVSNFHSTGTGVGAAIVEIAGNANTLAAGTGISPATGYGTDAGMVEPFALALDPSGNIWVSDEGANQVVMFFGLATPTATPVGPTPTRP